MTPSLRSHITDVMATQHVARKEQCEVLAAAVLTDPTLAAIIDLAAWAQFEQGRLGPMSSPEVRALLAAWRAER